MNQFPTSKHGLNHLFIWGRKNPRSIRSRRQVDLVRPPVDTTGGVGPGIRGFWKPGEKTQIPQERDEEPTGMHSGEKNTL